MGLVGSLLIAAGNTSTIDPEAETENTAPGGQTPTHDAERSSSSQGSLPCEVGKLYALRI